MPCLCMHAACALSTRLRVWYAWCMVHVPLLALRLSVEMGAPNACLMRVTALPAACCLRALQGNEAFLDVLPALGLTTLTQLYAQQGVLAALLQHHVSVRGEPGTWGLKGRFLFLPCCCLYQGLACWELEHMVQAAMAACLTCSGRTSVHCAWL